MTFADIPEATVQEAIHIYERGINSAMCEALAYLSRTGQLDEQVIKQAVRYIIQQTKGVNDGNI